MTTRIGVVLIEQWNIEKQSNTFPKIVHRLQDQGLPVFLTPSATSAQELEWIIEALPLDHIHLIGHSAGGMAATRISENPKVRSVNCFGYPFKHPQRPAEDYRTKHLRSISKPFLIIQGISDEYGAAGDQSDGLLPRQCSIVTLDCNHDYKDLTEFDFEQAWMALCDHIKA